MCKVIGDTGVNNNNMYYILLSSSSYEDGTKDDDSEGLSDTEEGGPQRIIKGIRRD